MASRSTIAVLAASSVATSGAAAALHGAMMPITIACAALAEGLTAWLSASAIEKKSPAPCFPRESGRSAGNGTQQRCLRLAFVFIMISIVADICETFTVPFDVCVRI
jgi:hypothetical protein